MQRAIQMITYGPDGTPTNLANNPKVAQYDYTLRDDGRKTQSIEKFWKSSSSTEFVTNTLTYQYDNLNRLTQEKLDSSDNTLDYQDNYKYDLVGNRLEKKHDVGFNGTFDVTTTMTFDANDRALTEFTDNLTGTDYFNSYAYTKTQQTLKTTYTGSAAVTAQRISSQEFSYDLQGRMEVATTRTYNTSNGTAVTSVNRTTYDYDARGARVSALQEIDTDNNGSWDTRTRTEFLNDGKNFTGYNQALRETSYNAISGFIQKQVDYTFGLDEISQTAKTYNALGTLTGTETLVFGHDGHGSVRVLMAMAGAMAQMFVYDAYGNMVTIFDSTGAKISGSAAAFANAALAQTNLLYSGEQFDTRIGQQYLRARYYDSTTGRFNRLDPFFGNRQDPQSFHKYAYVHSDPIQGIDPSGEILGLLFQFGLQSIRATGALGVLATIGGALSGGLLYQFRYGGNPLLGAKLGAQVGFAVTFINATEGKKGLGQAILKASFSGLGGWAVEYVLKTFKNPPENWPILKQEQVFLEKFSNSMMTQTFSYFATETMQDDDPYGLKTVAYVYTFAFLTAYTSNLLNEEKNWDECMTDAMASAFISTMNSEVVSSKINSLKEPYKSAATSAMGAGHALLIKSVREMFRQNA